LLDRTPLCNPTSASRVKRSPLRPRIVMLQPPGLLLLLLLLPPPPPPPMLLLLAEAALRWLHVRPPAVYRLSIAPALRVAERVAGFIRMLLMHTGTRTAPIPEIARLRLLVASTFQLLVAVDLGQPPILLVRPRLNRLPFQRSKAPAPAPAPAELRVVAGYSRILIWTTNLRRRVILVKMKGSGMKGWSS